ncbi:predicted protein [Lichtheimia corymbifera JMRC:FSU:9682]|uniref:Uncharacterized protein n=1 Tax=Lichtheimia corymbifera JMRC:FSU:9682 TaxID=1263082 RepID=A0A068S2B5_9FUNG|nr:predicted protein [Lichtheimia corymbifera JMRC:FSU:9682]
MDQFYSVQAVPGLFNFHLFRSRPLASSSSHSQRLPSFKYNYNLRTIALLPIHHVNPAAALTRLSLTECQAHGVYTPIQHPRFLTMLHLLLYTLPPQSNATAFVTEAAIGEASTPLSQVTCSNLSCSRFTWTADSHCIETALFTRTNLLQDIRIPMDESISTINYYYAMQAFFTWLICDESYQANDRPTAGWKRKYVSKRSQEFLLSTCWICNGYG